MLLPFINDTLINIVFEDHSADQLMVAKWKI